MIYRPFGASDNIYVTGLIEDLYQEDPGGKPISPEKIHNTLEFLSKNPDRGVVMVFDREGEIVGYAILINYYSNEFGGNIVNIDELYVRKEFRSQGVATNFIICLVRNRFGNLVALQLEVAPGNAGARKLYEKMGFKLSENKSLYLDI